MKTFLINLFVLFFITTHLSFCQSKTKQQMINSADSASTKKYEVQKTDEEWKKVLTPEQFSILREKDTEYPGTGKYDKFNEKGSYYCAGCGELLFESNTKFDAGCGWPSFYQAATAKGIEEKKDTTYGMVSVEFLCSKCGGHLGHVFPDGPQPTGLRYCVNSGSLDFKAKEKK